MDEGQAASTVGETDANAEERGGFGSLGSIIFLLALTWAAGIASFPLNDNSFFTHLATGRIILDEGSVPRSDPYTFTAAGEPWTVQSWLASVAYAGAEQLGGGVGLRLLLLVVFLMAMAVLWRLTRPAESILLRSLVVGAALFVVTDLWAERPYMIAVIGLGIVWLAMEGGVRPWLLVPLLWIWANSHGSFPLAPLLAVCLAVGAALDRRWRPRESATGAESAAEWSVHRPVLVAIGLGTVLSAAGPLGIELFTFPLTALSKAEVFAEVVEWRSPAFRSLAERSFLALTVVTLVLMVARRSWRLTIPMVVFVAAALVAQRNVVLALVVLVAVVSRSAPRIGDLTSRTRPKAGMLIAVACVGLLSVVSVGAVTSGDVGLGGYPARALAWKAEEGINGHMAAQIVTGNVLEVLDGPTGLVFVDDRVDMLPEAVFNDFLTLDRGRPDWQQVLDRHDIDVVLWERSEALGSLLAVSSSWQVVYSDTAWIVACPREDGCPVQP